MNLASQLLRHSRIRPDETAIFYGTAPWATFRQWAQRSYILGVRMRDLGLVYGDRVLVFARNHPRYLELMFACWWAGLVVVPVNARLHTKEVEWIIKNAQTRVGFVSHDIAEERLVGLEHQIDIESSGYTVLLNDTDRSEVIESPISSDGNDTAWLFYTSGTTGRPKGVQITHRNLLTMGLCYFSDVDCIGLQDLMVYGAPMSHGAGLYSIPHVIAGARHVIPQSGGVSAEELFEIGQTLGPLTTFAPPTIVNRLVEYAEKESLSFEESAAAFKTIVYGGAPMYLADIERALLIMGPRFVQIYGQGETPMVATVLPRRELLNTQHPRYRHRLGSVGIAQTLVEVRVVDQTGQTLPEGEIGEVVVRGDSVMKGYWRDPEATQAVCREGWLYTGDLGAFDADGFLTLKDRSKDLIICGGANIYPREVEEVLLTEPSVAEVAVIGAPDTLWGEVVVAFLVVKPGSQIQIEALDARCLSSIARFKRPKHYRIVQSLPKNNYGKVIKTRLREIFRDSIEI
ncbi:MAG: class I adenylate-forming enzyme family protein [Burkholderiales bacterium]|jgi:long-chain acyl-CoA synthetase